QISAVDVAGNTSSAASGPTFALEAHQESEAGITYTSGWLQRSQSFSMGGAVKTTSAAGKKATFSFTGTSVGWVSTRGADRGQVSVQIDGGAPTTVDLYSAA